MSTKTREIPLLTLPAVLFPGTFLPLHINRENHRLLLRGCVESHGPVGVLLDGSADSACAGSPRTTGCLASVALMLPEGQEQPSAILYGEQRMRVVDFTKQEPYLTGRIEVLDDYTGLHAERRGKQASSLFQHYLDLIRRRFDVDVNHLAFPDDPNMISYLLAAVLHLPLETKQRWLETASAAYRLEEELSFLRAECDKHATFLSLSQQTNHSYLTPDERLYAAIISMN